MVYFDLSSQGDARWISTSHPKGTIDATGSPPAAMRPASYLGILRVDRAGNRAQMGPRLVW